MKNENPIRSAIDESLSGVHFDARDMRSVMRAVRRCDDAPAPRRTPMFGMAMAAAILLIFVLPAGMIALRTQHIRTAQTAAAPGAQAVSQPEATSVPASPDGEREAVRIARACYEAVCDTSVFTFEEFTVSAELTEAAQYTVTLESIYGNGCSFSAVVSLTSGTVISHSAAQMATVPAALDNSAPQLQAWYAKNGPHLFTWPQAEQAEFSRRYEGARLRTARAGELDESAAAALAAASAAQALGVSSPACYPMLYAEEGNARYVVQCFAQPVADSLPEERVIVTFSPTGEGVRVEHVRP